MAVGVLAMAVVGIGAGFAQQSGGNVDTFLSKVAAKLGVSDDQMKTAVDQAYSETLDEQVAAGKLTQAQADALKTRGFDFGPMFGGPGERSPLNGVQIMDAAATALGMTRDDLMTQLKDGKSLADVATAQGISTEKLTADLLAQVKTQLDGLVSASKLTQAQADSMYAKTQSNIDQIVSGQMGLFGGGRGHGGPGTGPMTAPSDNSTPEGTAQPGL